jgi:thymidine kinase
MKKAGSIEVIVGSMFSGKTEELIRRLRRADLACQPIQVFKPVIDQRYRINEVASHNLTTIASQPIEKAEQIFSHLQPSTQVVGIDEGQFFDANIVGVVEELAARGLRVIIAGLDTDWQGKPFEPMPSLMAIAEDVLKQHAICVQCGETASRTQRTFSTAGTQSKDKILVGAHDAYEARCRRHFKPEVDHPTIDWRRRLKESLGHPALTEVAFS